MYVHFHLMMMAARPALNQPNPPIPQPNRTKNKRRMLAKDKDEHDINLVDKTRTGVAHALASCAAGCCLHRRHRRRGASEGEEEEEGEGGQQRRQHQQQRGVGARLRGFFLERKDTLGKMVAQREQELEREIEVAELETWGAMNGACVSRVGWLVCVVIGPSPWSCLYPHLDRSIPNNSRQPFKAPEARAAPSRVPPLASPAARPAAAGHQRWGLSLQQQRRRRRQRRGGGPYLPTLSRRRRHHAAAAAQRRARAAVAAPAPPEPHPREPRILPRLLARAGTGRMMSWWLLISLNVYIFVYSSTHKSDYLISPTQSHHHPSHGHGHASTASSSSSAAVAAARRRERHLKMTQLTHTVREQLHQLVGLAERLEEMEGITRRLMDKLEELEEDAY